MIILTACQKTTEIPPTSAVTAVFTPSLGAYFPQIISEYGARSSLDIMPEPGLLVLENGCLRLKISNPNSFGDNFLILWDLRFSTRTDTGVVQVIDNTTGETLATMGDYVELDGGHPVNMQSSEFEFLSPIPNECNGPYMIVGEAIRKITPP